MNHLRVVASPNKFISLIIQKNVSYPLTCERCQQLAAPRNAPSRGINAQSSVADTHQKCHNRDAQTSVAAVYRRITQ